MIVGLGTDIIDIERIRNAYMRHGERFVSRILTAPERQQCHENEWIPFLAKRFAAKEAFAKALGIGIRSIMSWQAISILRDDHGKPFVFLHSTALIKKLTDMAIDKIHVSIADEKMHAIAFVILEANNSM